MNNGWTQKIAELEGRLKPIREAWDHFKHLDSLLSDESWMKDEEHPMTPQRHCLYDCWMAIKEANRE